MYNIKISVINKGHKRNNEFSVYLAIIVKYILYFMCRFSSGIFLHFCFSHMTKYPLHFFVVLMLGLGDFSTPLSRSLSHTSNFICQMVLFIFIWFTINAWFCFLFLLCHATLSLDPHQCCTLSHRAHTRKPAPNARWPSHYKILLNNNNHSNNNDDKYIWQHGNMHATQQPNTHIHPTHLKYGAHQ